MKSDIKRKKISEIVWVVADAHRNRDSFDNELIEMSIEKLIKLGK